MISDKLYTLAEQFSVYADAPDDATVFVNDDADIWRSRVTIHCGEADDGAWDIVLGFEDIDEL